MKKLVIAAAIVCAVALSQAASVNWTVSVLKGGDGANITTAKGYTFTLAIFDAASSTKIGESSTGTVSMNKVMSNIDGTSTSHNYYAVLSTSNDDYTLADTIANTKFYFTTEDSATYSINLTTGAGITTPSTGIGTWSADSWKAVPEPTSGLLMLLGVAGLALKRKRA